ncbi:tetracycline resistance transcriptional repressor TetR [Burkholderia sp. FERM BP-3421]|uniref:tetracycline resistance transcriptional repressor TetR n=1 Tax=Burkholderia sp. FERM BP-3421 TaxID=1494466 RepID=UPI0023621934|nr:tetracycline resistance transcriptional repressor TetR [Burkholderia sp. FERM BP-3421]WDD93425.1 tetracycline resistance transcriptional repressor TetR [Burkholderia sp. FERM BP-3421]
MAKLQREQVIDAALALLDEVGMDGLTTRLLAERLGVQQPALYWHFNSKRALLDALADALLSRHHTCAMPRDGDDWRSFVADNARSFRGALLACRDGARVHAGSTPDAPHFAAVEAQLRLLGDAGFTPVAAAHALLMVSQYVVGAVLEQQSAASGKAGRAPNRAEPSAFLRQAFEAVVQAGPDAHFEQGLAIILDGLAHRLERA